MIIDMISDLHGYFPKLDWGDLLIICGDYTASDKITQWGEFFGWLKRQNYRKKILIAGNHDHFMESSFPKTQEEADDLKDVQEIIGEEMDFEYLCNSGTEFEGLKIWGTPHSLLFPGVNPRCTAFMGTEEELKDKYDLIPDDIDILISHGPPYGILDSVERVHRTEYTGSKSLREAMFRVKPKLMVWGHIHEHRGKEIDLITTKCVNVSHVNEYYEPVNKPVRIIL